jgi:tRNA modification GTPase
MNECDVIIWVADLSRRFYNNDIEEPVLNAPGASVIWVWNKSDLPSVCSARARERVSKRWTTIALSAKTGEGISLLHEALKQLLLNKIPAVEDQVLLLRVRHRDLLRRCEAALSRACEALGGEYLPELVGEDIAEALAAVGELTGVISSEDLLDSIFADFCIGK